MARYENEEANSWRLALGRRTGVSVTPTSLCRSGPAENVAHRCWEWLVRVDPPDMELMPITRPCASVSARRISGRERHPTEPNSAAKTLQRSTARTIPVVRRPQKTKGLRRQRASPGANFGESRLVAAGRSIANAKSRKVAR